MVKFDSLTFRISMANTKSAKKAIRVTSRKTLFNLRTKKAYKKARRDFNKAVVSEDLEKAKEFLSLAYKQIDKAAKKNVIHRNTASRYKSKLAKKLASIEKLRV